MSQQMLTTIRAYTAAGLPLLPNDPKTKYPSGYGAWQKKAFGQAVLERHVKAGGALGLRCGDGREVIDLDLKAVIGNRAAFLAHFEELAEIAAPGLLARLVIAETQSGGRHYGYYCADLSAGNLKLAMRPPTAEELADDPRKKEVTLIETRGQGGQIQIAPSPGYRLLQGSWDELPEITRAERDALLSAARALTQRAEPSRMDAQAARSTDRPGDVYNSRDGEREALDGLLSASWDVAYERGGTVYLRRPGKRDGISATYGYVAPGVLYVFSSNASPFEPDRAYSPFAVYTMLAHDGNYASAARALSQRYGLSAPAAPAGAPAAAREYVVAPTPESWIGNGITLAQLQSKHFADLRWVVQDILPEGVALVAAKPKAKKSWLALGVAVAVSMGGKALGHLDTDQGRVLFLDLEGNQRRIQSRARAMLGNGGVAWPDNFHVYTEWGKGDEGIAMLEQWMAMQPDTRLVVIDLLAEFRPPMDPKMNAYDYDRGLLVALNKFAERHHIAILVIHHTRKAKGEDVFDEVSGTLGINGAVATLWIISKSLEGHTILNMTGRDLQKDEPLALSWDTYLCNFTIEGPASEIAVSEERRAILALMDDDSQWTPKQLAAELGKSVGSIQQLLRDMIQDGTVDKAGYGKYSRVPGKSGTADKSGKSGKSGNSYSGSQTLTGRTVGGKSSVRQQDAVNGNSYRSYHDSYEPTDEEIDADIERIEAYRRERGRT